MNNNCQTRQKMLRKVQVHGFAMLEAGLYLDGHPKCQRAMHYFTMHRDAYLKAVAEFEAVYGPLTMKDTTDGECWNWVQGPWPWESEAN